MTALNVGDRVTWGSRTVACVVLEARGRGIYVVREYAWCDPEMRDRDDAPDSVTDICVDEEDGFAYCDKEGNILDDVADVRQEHSTGLRLSDLIAPPTPTDRDLVEVDDLKMLAKTLDLLARLDTTKFDRYSGPAAAAARQACITLRGIARNTLPIILANDFKAIPHPPIQPNGDDELA